MIQDYQAPRIYFTFKQTKKHSLMKTIKSIRTKGSAQGFTLVEILVVIAIIAILAGIALPAVTGAIKKGKESAAVQQANGLELACLQYSLDNNEVYPGGQPTATPPVTVSTSTQFFELIVNGYLNNNTDTLCLGGSKSKYMGTTPSTGLGAANVSWDTTTLSTGAGVTSSDPDQLPIIMSTGSTVNYGAAGTPAAATATITDSTKNPFINDGIAVAYKDGSSKFNICTTPGQPFPISSTTLDPASTYEQLEP
jgi:prepilin-type N-terminal cleavage/methylation domain-containing protein